MTMPMMTVVVIEDVLREENEKESLPWRCDGERR